MYCPRCGLDLGMIDLDGPTIARGTHALKCWGCQVVLGVFGMGVNFRVEGQLQTGVDTLVPVHLAPYVSPPTSWRDRDPLL